MQKILSAKIWGGGQMHQKWVLYTLPPSAEDIYSTPVRRRIQKSMDYYLPFVTSLLKGLFLKLSFSLKLQVRNWVSGARVAQTAKVQ